MDLRIESLILALFIFCACPNVNAASSVENLRDPLHPGSSLRLILQDDLGAPTQTSTELQYTKTFDNNLAFEFGIPFIIASQKDSTANAPVPRVGGGTYGRVFGGLTARFLGNEESYVNTSIDVGLPIFQDKAVQNTVNSTLVITGILIGHLKISRFAIEGNLSDEDEFPVHYTVGANQEYADTQSHVTASALVFWYVLDRLDLFIHYSENFPFHSDRGIDNGESATISSTSTTGRTILLGPGFDYALNAENLLATFAIRKALDSPARAVGSTSFQGDLKWIF